MHYVWNIPVTPVMRFDKNERYFSFCFFHREMSRFQFLPNVLNLVPATVYKKMNLWILKCNNCFNIEFVQTDCVFFVKKSIYMKSNFVHDYYTFLRILITNFIAKTKFILKFFTFMIINSKLWIFRLPICNNLYNSRILTSRFDNFLCI